MAEFPDEEPVLAALFKEPAAAAAVSGEPDDGLAYDGSDGPQRRPLEPGERRLLHRVIGLVADDPRWQWEQIAQRPEIPAAIGDGTQPQARDLTARERDDVCRMVSLLSGEFLYQDRPGHHLPPYFAELTGGDIARLNLIAGVSTPRPDDADHRVVVHMADWMPPVGIPPGWEVACAPRPIGGLLTWQGEDRGHGEFYAAAPPVKIARSSAGGATAPPTTRGGCTSRTTSRSP